MTIREGILTSLSIFAFGLAGCGLGSSDGDDDNPDPDQGALGVLCTADLSVTGTFAPTNAPPAPDPNDPNDPGWSCVPEGKWTVDVQVSDQGNCSEVPIAAQYVYTVTVDAETEEYIATYGDDPNSDFSYLKVSIEGPCIGNFEHFSTDGKQVTTLRPHTADNPDDLTITGSGTYELFNSSQWDDPQQ
ncbi:MAG: hypothetical protein MJE77_43150 [Proteobacteria bacterium]|nr:hypothetical protein [Pseudomonadota bacterium]